jgi:Tetracyclin repressor-like, C-terminal domain/SnoaL-like domain
VDAKDWDATKGLFDRAVRVDFTSLTGGEPATISGSQLVDGWRQGLHAQKRSFHMVGHYRLVIDGDVATAAVKGYAYNVLDQALGGGMWEVWGAASAGIARYQARIARAIPADDADLRAAIISAITLGLTVSRHLIKSDELATADPAQVIRLLRPVMLSLADHPDNTGPP